MAGGDILGTGVSALLAFQRSLATTSHNVANVNTEGYSRQRVELGTKSPEFAGFGYIGRGVDIADVRRMYSDALVLEIRNSTATKSQLEAFNTLASQLDNLVADPDAGISPALQGFFDSVGDVANEPGSIPARQVMISQAEALVDRFEHFNNRFNIQYKSVNDQLGTAVQTINTLSAALANLNEDIVAAVGAGGGAMPNDLLDTRDRLLNQLAQQVGVSVVEEDDGAINVFIGKGQLIVNRNQSRALTLVQNEFDPTRVEVALKSFGSTVNISNQLSGGVVGGALQFRDEVLDPARNALGRVAIGLAMDFNAQHRLGLDLQGRLGQDFFSVSPAAVSHSTNNNGSGVIGLSFVDPSQLTLSDYRMTYNGSDVYTVRRLSDDRAFTLTIPAGPTGVTLDGFQISVTAPPAVGDTFLLQPTSRGAETIATTTSDVTRIAAASPVRGTTALTNTGNGVLSATTITDATSYVPGNYSLIFADNAISGAPSAGTGQPTDTAANSNLEYELIINGVSVYTQDEATGALTLDQLATQINASVGTTGVRAYVDNANNVLYLANDPATRLPITVQERLNATGGDTLEAGDAVVGYFGSVLNDTTSSNTLTFGTSADSYVVLDGSATVVASAAYTSGAAIDFNGIHTTVSGRPNVGDTFSLAQNSSGMGDNSNALALAALRVTPKLANGTATYQEAYGQLVAQVGTSTHQAELNFRAQDALLRSAQASRDALSGVNLDEEAANMLKFQQAYQAAARVIATADTLFQSLLDAVRR